MNTIAKTPLNNVDIRNLIDLALENKMPWNALAYLLKDTTTYDPKQVIENLLKALEELHLKTLETDPNYKESLADETENVAEERLNEETSSNFIEANKVYNDQVDSIISDFHSIKGKSKTVEDDIKILEMVEEILNEGTNDFEETFEERNLSENDEHEASIDENEWYTFVTNDKVTDSETIDNTEMNFKENKSEENVKSIVVNENKKSVQCTFCEKLFKEFRYLKQHERIHTGELSYECEKCNKRFMQKGHLRSHEVKHTGEESHECKTCKKRFKQKYGLDMHVRIHTGEKPLQCMICEKCFTFSVQLKKHEKTHSREKPFKNA